MEQQMIKRRRAERSKSKSEGVQMAGNVVAG